MKLDQIRKKIDKIDDQIIHLLVKRKACTLDVGKYKKENGLKIFQPKREQEVLKARSRLAKKYGLDQGFIRDIFKSIFKDSRKIQKNV